MDQLREQPTTLPSLDTLKAATYAQILALSERKEGLQKISTNITDLIARYNAQKSYLGHASYWYGELDWWLRLIVSTVAAGVAILLTVPWVISIALSLVASFLLMNHYEVTQARDRLICTDLNEQNISVQTSLEHLNDTKKELEKSLESLCKLTMAMGEENQKLRINVDVITHQAEEYRSTTIHLQSQIEELQEKNTQLSIQVSDAQKQVSDYADMLKDGTLTYTRMNAELEQTVAETQVHITEILDAAARFVKGVDTMTSPMREVAQHSPDSDNGRSSVLDEALALLGDSELDDQLFKLEQQEHILRTPNRDNTSLRK